jgi:hypothetical protein
MQAVAVGSVNPVGLDRMLLILATLAAVAFSAVLWLKTTYSSPGFSAKPSAAASASGWVVTAVAAVEPNQTVLSSEWVGKTLQRVCAAQTPEHCVVLEPSWLTDSPIVLPSTSAQWAFVRDQQALLALGSTLTVHSSQGEQASVELRPVHSGALDERVAVQLVTALLIYTMGCTLLAFVRRTADVWLAFAMCSGYCVLILARIWFTSRSWALPQAHWWLALAMIKVGIVTCAGCAMLVLRSLRLPHRFHYTVYAAVAGITTIIALHSMGVIDSVLWGYKTPLLACLFVVMGISVYSAFSKSDSPSDQASKALGNRTFVQFISLGFAPVLALTLLWVLKPDLPHVGFLTNFAIASAGLPIVTLVSRSSHYGMQRFWWAMWMALIASTLGIVGAAALAFVFRASAATALAIGLISASWVVYLLRGWLAARLLGNPIPVEASVPKLMALSALPSDRVVAQWHQILREAFDSYQAAPCELDPGQSRTDASIQAQGDTLVVPDLDGNGALALTGSARYTRSFTQADVLAANTLLALAVQGLAARDAFSQGARQERRRIAADLHDDIGGKLLHLANAPSHAV